MNRYCYPLMIVMFARYMLSNGKPVETSRKCLTQEDCVTKNVRNKCAICAESPGSSSKEAKCIYFWPAAFQQSPDCEKHDKKSCPLKCSGRGECATNDGVSKRYYEPYCVCSAPYYGDDCQYEGANGDLPLRFFRSWVKLVMYPVCIQELMHLYIDSPKAESLQYSFVMDYRKTFRMEYSIEKVNSKEKSWKDVYKITVINVLPYKFKGVYINNDTKVGYSTSLTARIYDNSALVYEKSFNFFAHYDNMNLKCIPTVQVFNCAKDLDKAVSFSRPSSVVINVKVVYLRDGGSVVKTTPDLTCLMLEKVSWKIRKLAGSQNSQFTPIFEDNKSTRTISFPPYKLDIGRYETEIEIANVRPGLSTRNIGVCYFKVVCLPLVADIRGGNDRMVSSANPVSLRADTSYDPNKPSDDQDHVLLHWSCVNTLHPDRKEEVCKERKVRLQDDLYLEPGSLTPGGVYKFTLKVHTELYDGNPDCKGSDVSPKFAYVTIVVANKTAVQMSSIVINCLTNCRDKVVPSEELILKASQMLGEEVVEGTAKYNWFYYTNDTEAEVSADDIRAEDLPSYMLLIKENALKPDTEYTIVVRTPNSTWYAKYNFLTMAIDFNAECSVSPPKGDRAYSIFRIECSNITNPSNAFLHFEFYDKTDQEANSTSVMFSGRMLGTSPHGELNDVRLTRGNVHIYVINEYGQFVKILVKVDLTDRKLTNADLDLLYRYVEREVKVESVSSALEMISVIPDIVPSDANGTEKGRVLNKIIELISELPLKDLADMKICASALSNALFTLNKPNQLHLKPHIMKKTFYAITHQAHLFSKMLTSGEDMFLSPKEVDHMSTSMLNTVQIALSCKEEKKNVQDYYLDLAVLNDLSSGSSYLGKTLEFLSDALSMEQVSGKPIKKVPSSDESIRMWVVESDRRTTMAKITSSEKQFPVVIGENINSYLESELYVDENLALQVTALRENIYWWSESNVGSTLVSVSLKAISEDAMEPISYLRQPIDITLDVKGDVKITKITGSMVQVEPDTAIDSESRDLAIKIHRFDDVQRSLITFHFLFPATNSDLRVLVVSNYRPDYDMMMQKATKITEKSPVYPVDSSSEERAFLYMGVLPGADVEKHKVVNYSFNINTTVCQSWAKGQWSSVGCQPIKVENGQVRCGCTHLSIFSAAFPVTPNEVDPFNDIKLFLTVSQNPLVVVLVTSLFLLYFLVALLVWRRDIKSNRKRNIIVLEDNFPDEKYPYLVVVFTSARFDAGTTANVGFKLIGKKDTSRAHIFASKDRKVLQRQDDDWFVMFCPRWLGDLDTLHIWHDDVGSSPDWFCDKVVVFDLTSQTETLFIVEDWLAMTEDEYPEAYVLTAATYDIKKFKYYFFYNFVLCLRERHDVMSIVSCHPRSSRTKLQRVSAFFCGVTTAMLCSIMFYLPEDEQVHWDGSSVSLRRREMLVSIQTIVICVAITFFVGILFDKSCKINYTRQKSILRVRDSTTDDDFRESIEYTGPRNKKTLAETFYKDYVRAVTKVLKPKTMEPAQLPGSQPVVVIRKVWFVIAWTACIAITLTTSFFTMLYGLKLGLVHSKEWVLSLILGVFVDAFIFAPFRIILISLLLAGAFRNLYDLESYRVGMTELVLNQIPNSEEYMRRLIELRKQPMYSAPREERRIIMMAKSVKRVRYMLCFDFAISLFLLVTVHCIIYKIWTSQYHSNYQTVTSVTDSHLNFLNALDFDEVSDIQGLENFLKISFVNALYNLRWYNKRLLDKPGVGGGGEKYWVHDFTHRMLGLPQVRQLRVVPNTCNNEIFKRKTCLPKWSVDTEDRDDYGVRWKPAEWTDEISDSPWRYKEKETSFLNKYRVLGKSRRFYSFGGYLAVLGPTRKDTAKILAELRENRWLDRQTRVVVVELTFYNVNLYLTTQVTLMVELLVAGMPLLKSQGVSVMALSFITPWNVTFVILIFYYLVTCVYQMNRQGVVTYLSHFTHACRLLIVFSGMLAMISVALHHFLSKQYFTSFLRAGFDNAFNFDKFVTYSILLRHAFTLLLSVAILHTIVLLRFGRHLLTNFYMLTLSLKWIFWLSTVVFVILLILLYISTFMNIFVPYKLKALMLKANSVQNFKTNQLERVTVQCFVVFKMVAITLCMWSFVAQFIHYLRLARVHNIKQSDDFNFFSIFRVNVNK